MSNFEYLKSLNSKFQTKSFLANIHYLALFSNKTDITYINFAKSAKAFL